MPGVLDGRIESALDRVIHPGARLVRLHVEKHPGLGHALTTLSVVARATGRYNVVPCMEATAAAGNDMVDREFMSVATTVLARETVADEDFPACQFYSWAWSTDEVHQSNDGGGGENRRWGCDAQRTCFENLGFPVDHHHKGSTNVAYIQRLIILIQHKNGVIHPDKVLCGQGCFGCLRTRNRVQPAHITRLVDNITRIQPQQQEIIEVG